MIVSIFMSLLAPEVVEFNVGPDQRTAHVVRAEAKSAPLVIVYHGHGGTAEAARKSFAIEKHWPEAMVIYPQGLPTATQRDPEGKRNGWNARTPADNRDVAFFDTLLDWATKHGADPKRVFVTGHSNGGGFTYLLGTQRGDKLRAVAPSSAGPSQRAKEFPSIPVMHLMGEKDVIVPLANQERMVAALRERFGYVETEGTAKGMITAYEREGAPNLHVFRHPGGHSLPVSAYPAIVEFFKRFSRE